MVIVMEQVEHVNMIEMKNGRDWLNKRMNVLKLFVMKAVTNGLFNRERKLLNGKAKRMIVFTVNATMRVETYFGVNVTVVNTFSKCV